MLSRCRFLEGWATNPTKPFQTRNPIAKNKKTKCFPLPQSLIHFRQLPESHAALNSLKLHLAMNRHPRRKILLVSKCVRTICFYRPLVSGQAFPFELSKMPDSLVSTTIRPRTRQLAFERIGSGTAKLLVAISKSC